ncbi:hypothetical protein HYH03_009264 [Edaphochlamys debaryana]|uniref:Nuclear pore complex protein Nup88 n=1 Tax=Edaphochlamys debaryana TaxID=47281 RepID=A0A836BX31_9CHLO|nr:hypothetical protein HYH03_009264 [Edaphochlamys debaryana]|eukprot:KAG2492311.1 hypothetical protein HYH03_009264 [Edaphochlamys debaryana]
MAVVDLHGGQPLRAGTASGGPGSRQKQCRLHAVDPVLFGGRPGLVLFQASWHPHSEEHLLVLTSDNRLRLYHVTHSLAAAEQTLHLVPHQGPVPQRYGLGGALGATPGATPAPASPSPSPLALTGGPNGAASGGGTLAPDVVAFTFGPAVGWGLFTLMLLGSDGHVYALGPVAPFGMRCSGSLLERLAREEAAAAEWIEAAFGEEAVGNPAARSRWPVRPHVVEGASPALAGPLNPRARQELPVGTSRAATLAVVHTLTAGAAPSGPTSTPGGTPTGPEPGCVSTAVVGFADGRLLAYAVAGPWAPAWCDSQPQFLAAGGSSGSAPSAVRYRCTLKGPAAGAGVAGIGSVAAAGAAVVTPRMVLLDVVELPAAVGGREASEEEDEEEEDEEADVDGLGGAAATSVVAAARRAVTLVMQGGGAAAGGASAAPATAWVCQRARGCWSVTLPWSAQLPKWLGAGRPAQLPAELPAPVVTCVYEVPAAAASSATPAAAATAAGCARVVGACLLANPLLGGGLLALSGSGTLQYFQPVGAAELLAAEQQRLQQLAGRGAGEQQAPATPGTPGAAGSATPAPASPELRRAQVDAHIKSVYGSLMEPPPDRKLPQPPPGSPSPLTIAAKEGPLHLANCVAALRERHMRYLHGASSDLQARAASLAAEAGKHAAAVTELAGVAAEAEARQAGLEARISRLTSLHANLVERAGVLAGLHWSLPRALSRSEAALRDELGALEGRTAGLRAQWEALATRARRLCEERRSGGPGAAGGRGMRVASVPEAQLEKVHDSIVAQYRGLTAARAALAALEGHVAAAAAEHTAEQLERGLGLAGAGAGLGAGLGGGLGTPRGGAGPGLRAAWGATMA